MNTNYFETFIESLRTKQNSDLLDTILEGFSLTYQPQMEGFGDTLRDMKNRVKTIGASGKEALFGASEEQSFKNTIARTILNKKLYDSKSRRGKDAINQIVTLIAHGTHNPALPNKIANMADDVLADCIETAVSNNHNLNVKIVDPEALRRSMDSVFDEISESVIKPLEKMGKMRLNDDRVAYVTDWWDKNVVTKMGKYFDCFKDTKLKITPRSNTQGNQQNNQSNSQNNKPVNPPPNPEQPVQAQQQPVQPQTKPQPVQPKPQAKPQVNAKPQAKAKPQVNAQPQVKAQSKKPARGDSVKPYKGQKKPVPTPPTT